MVYRKKSARNALYFALFILSTLTITQILYLWLCVQMSTPTYIPKDRVYIIYDSPAK